jgi:hypothetical protein
MRLRKYPGTQFGIKVVVVDIPRPPKHHPAIDVQPSGNGKPPGENNEQTDTLPYLIPARTEGIYSSSERRSKAKMINVCCFDARFYTGRSSEL